MTFRDELPCLSLNRLDRAQNGTDWTNSTVLLQAKIYRDLLFPGTGIPLALQLPSSIRSGKHCLRTLVALVTLGLADSDSIPMMVRSVLSRP